MKLFYKCEPNPLKIQSYSIMKSLKILILTAIILSYSCNRNKPIDSSIVSNPLTGSSEKSKKYPIVKFDTTVYDFGRITEGEIVEHSFVIKNEGEGNLLIATVQPDCGCTVAYYPRYPIESGASDTIKITFDSEGRRGQVYRQIKVVTNANPSTYVLVLRGEVVGPN